jgi:hypothetical protein
MEATTPETERPLCDKHAAHFAERARLAEALPKCGECLMERVEIVTLRPDGSCPGCDAAKGGR